MEQCQRCGATDELWRFYYEGVEGHSTFCEECSNLYLSENHGNIGMSAIPFAEPESSPRVNYYDPNIEE